MRPSQKTMGQGQRVVQVDGLLCRLEGAVAEDEEGQQFDYVQRSARFRFPDIITVRFISVATYHSESQSTLAIYSRSIYGEDDFGVNRERIEGWLKTLHEGL